MEKSGVSVVVDGVSCFELRLDHTKSLNNHDAETRSVPLSA